MMGDAKEQLRAVAAADVCARCELETDPTELLAASSDAVAFLDALLARGAAMDAVRFLGHALEPRQAVWWAWDVAQRSAPPNAKPPVLEALAATSAWLVEPTDEHRRAAHEAAETCGFDAPAGCVALAVFLAEGSLGPPDLEQPVPPPPGACAKAVIGAVLLAAVGVPEQAYERAAGFVARWFELAAGEAPWTAEAPAAGAAPDQPSTDGSGYDTNLKF